MEPEGGPRLKLNRGLYLNKYGSVLVKCVAALSKDEKPMTVSELRQRLEPLCNTVAVCDPIRVLEELSKSSGSDTDCQRHWPKQIQVQYKHNERVHMRYICHMMADQTSIQCEKHNMKRILLRHQELGEEKYAHKITSKICQNIQNVAWNMRGENWDVVSEKLSKTFYLTKQYTTYNQMKYILENLKQCGFIDMKDEKITYKDIPEFVILCLQQLVRKYEKKVNRDLKSGYERWEDVHCYSRKTGKVSKRREQDSAIQHLITQVNVSIGRLKQCLEAREGDTGWKVADLVKVTDGVEAMVKTGPESREKTGYERVMERYPAIKRHRRLRLARLGIKLPKVWAPRYESYCRHCAMAGRRERAQKQAELITEAWRKVKGEGDQADQTEESKQDTDQEIQESRRECGHKPDMVNQDDSFQRKLRKLCKTEGLIKSLSTDLSVLTLDDIREIPLKLKPESLYVMLELVKMGSSKPKTVPALCNSLRQSCKFMYMLPPVSTLARVFVKVQKENDRSRYQPTVTDLLTLYTVNKTKYLPLDIRKLLVALGGKPREEKIKYKPRSKKKRKRKRRWRWIDLSQRENFFKVEEADKEVDKVEEQVDEMKGKMDVALEEMDGREVDDVKQEVDDVGKMEDFEVEIDQVEEADIEVHGKKPPPEDAGSLQKSKGNKKKGKRIRESENRRCKKVKETHDVTQEDDEDEYLPKWLKKVIEEPGLNSLSPKQVEFHKKLCIYEGRLAKLIAAGQRLRTLSHVVYTKKTFSKEASVVPASEEQITAIVKNARYWLDLILQSQKTNRMCIVPDEKLFLQELIGRCLAPDKVNVEEIIKILQEPCIYKATDAVKNNDQVSPIKIGEDGSVTYQLLDVAAELYQSHSLETRLRLMSGYKTYTEEKREVIKETREAQEDDIKQEQRQRKLNLSTTDDSEVCNYDPESYRSKYGGKYGGKKSYYGKHLFKSPPSQMDFIKDVFVELQKKYAKGGMSMENSDLWRNLYAVTHYVLKLTKQDLEDKVMK